MGNIWIGPWAIFPQDVDGALVIHEKSQLSGIVYAMKKFEAAKSKGWRQLMA